MRRWYYHLAVLAVGIVVATLAAVDVIGGETGWKLPVALLIGVPLAAIVARFPMVMDRGYGGIEVGFDSCILMFLLCTLGTGEALLVWSTGVLLTQILARKLLSSTAFNIGVGIVAGALAAWMYVAVGADHRGTPRELLAVALAAAAYFLTDYVLSGLSVAIGSRTSLQVQLLQRGTLLAIACFVPLDLLGYLGAVVARATPWWTVSLLTVPLVTLLIATRAVTRGREDARRLNVLFAAAVRAQTLDDRDAVVAALVDDAAQLLRLHDVQLRGTPPGDGEIGVEVQLGADAHWLTARSLNRAMSSAAADEQALGALAAVASDAVSRLALTTEMVHVARHDPLTDLPNRGILIDRVTEALDDALRRGTRVALLFIDLDGFKPINDRYGHAVGDDVLVEVAERLRRCVRERDIVARLGGDEFAILLDDIGRILLPEMCERILAAIDEGVRVGVLDGGQHVPLGASMGLAYGTGAESPNALLRNADLAMYEAKASGKGRYVEFTPALGRARLERLEMADDLRTAIQAGAIDVVYQPVIAVSDDSVVGAEALARWRRNGVPVPPDVFIPIAEETGLIVGLGRSVLNRVAADTVAIRRTIDGDFSVGVNISAAQLRDPAFLETVADAVRTMRGTQLVLEITERQGIDLDAEVLATMRAITDMGVVFAIDDFGVGFSSISYLHDLPAGIVKADKTLSAGIDSDERARALLRSVVAMGGTLGLDVVVEGIERDTQLAVVTADAPRAMVQGYLLHRPMPLADLLDVLRLERQGARR